MTSSSSVATTVDFLKECKLALLVRKDEKMFDADYVLLSRGTWGELQREVRELREKVNRLLLAEGAPGSLLVVPDKPPCT